MKFIDVSHIQTLSDVGALYPPRHLTDGQEVVRIGPSPTGMPHIGTAMQAVINASIAEKSNGIFILRIEDTDQKRTVPGAVDAIHDFLKWMDIHVDEGIGENPGSYGPYTQSERLPIYQAAANHLLEKGSAYRCFCTQEHLNELREKQKAANEDIRYDGTCANLNDEDVKVRLANGDKNVIRLRSPKSGKVSFTDLVRGKIEFDLSTVDDTVLLKSDGFPTYHLASTVDDHFMGVTKVIRGEEWISSTPKHLILYKAFGWQVPQYLHTVLLRNEKKQKLSKRSGDTSIDAFRAQGYTPEGFRNFLTRLMWAHPESKDVYPAIDFVNLMETHDLPKAGPVVDIKMLDHINGHYIVDKKPKELRQDFQEYLQFLLNHKRLPTFPEDVDVGMVTFEKLANLQSEIENNPDYCEKALSLEPERNHKFSDILVKCPFFFDATFVPPKEENLTKFIQNKSEIVNILAEVARSYDPAIGHDAWVQSLKSIAQNHNTKDKAVFMLTRLAITGAEKTPPLYETLQIVGSNTVQKRLLQAQQLVQG